MKDEHFYEIAAEEVRLSGPNAGLWAKALVVTNGDKQKAEAMYFRLRVAQLMEAHAESEKKLQEQRAHDAANEQARITAELKAKGYVAGIPPNGVAGLIIFGGIIFC